MAKKKPIRTRKKTGNNGLVYFFLVPVVAVLFYLIWKPQTFAQVTNTAVVPTFTSIGDCVANQVCPTLTLPAEINQTDVDQTDQDGSQPTTVTQSPVTTSGTADQNQLVTRLIDMINQLLGDNCKGAADLRSNSVEENDISANRWHRKYKKHHRHNRRSHGLWHLLKCLKRNPGHDNTTVQQEPVHEPTQPPAEQEQQQQEIPTEVPQVSQIPSLPQQSAVPSTAPVVQAANVVTGDCGTVISKAQLLNDTLEIGSANGRYSNQTQGQSDCGYNSETWSGTSDETKYWCTYLIVDAYNLAGFKGLSIAEHAAVVNMRSWWQDASDYIYVPNNE
ncbi:MAG TPA: hypothetical protein V6C65_25970, partial [Allocoleopsis sp.]